MNPDRFSGPQLSLGLAVVPRTLVGKDLANATLDTPLERNDCTVRAVAAVCGAGYLTAYNAIAARGRKARRRFYLERHAADIADELGHSLRLVRRSGTLARLIADFPNDRLLCHKRGHAFAVMASRVSDGTSLRSKIRHAWIVTPKGDAS